MKVRGIDPGEHVGWCDLDAGEGGPATYMASGECTPAGAMALVESGFVYAIERAYGLRVTYPVDVQKLKATVERLLDTNWLACQLVEECKRRGVRVFEIDQHKARIDVGVQFDKAGKKQGDMSVDKQVAECVKGLVRGWPAGARATNKHKRDAAVYALQGCHLLSVEAGRRHDAEANVLAEQWARAMTFHPTPPGTFGPGDCGPDSFGGSDY